MENSKFIKETRQKQVTLPEGCRTPSRSLERTYRYYALDAGAYEAVPELEEVAAVRPAMARSNRKIGRFLATRSQAQDKSA